MENTNIRTSETTVSLLLSFRPSLFLPHPLPPFLSLAHLLTESLTFGLSTISIAIAISAPASILTDVLGFFPPLAPNGATAALVAARLSHTQSFRI